MSFKAITGDWALVSLSLDNYGVTPSSSAVYVRELRKGFSVYLEADKELLPKPVRIGSTKKDYCWNHFGRILCQIQEGWIGEESYELVDVTGETGVKAEILVLCWGYPEGNKQLIDWLLEQDNNTLEYLFTHLGSLFNEDNVQFLCELLELIRRIGHRESLLDSVARHKSLKTFYMFLEGQKEDLEEVEKCRQDNILKPFLPQISAALNKHGDDYRARHPMAESKSMRLEKWLKDYILSNGGFPSGEHNVEVPCRQSGIKNLGLIDFDGVGQ